MIMPSSSQMQLLKDSYLVVPTGICHKDYVVFMKMGQFLTIHFSFQMSITFLMGIHGFILPFGKLYSVYIVSFSV